jgi:hypothetical protein
MFKRNPIKNFERCAHKEVKFTESSNVSGATYLAALVCPRTEETGLVVRVKPMPSKETSTHVTTPESTPGFSYVVFRSNTDAYEELAACVAKLVCRGCEFVDKTPLQLAEYRATQAEEALTIAQFELRAAQALKATEEARAEVDRISRTAE